jgi:long-chain acyl-CoA synthetase
MEGAKSPGDTFPRRLLEQARTSPDRPALRQKALGIWQSWSWREVAEQAREAGAGLFALGVRRGTPVAILGRNRPRLYLAMLGAQAIGALPVPIYEDASADEIAPLLARLEVAYAVAENQEQVDKLLQLRRQTPALAHIVYTNARGLDGYSDAGLVSFERLIEAGRPHAAQVDAELARGAPEDVAVVLHTSGTTGDLKIVRLTHAALIHTASAIARIEGLTEREEVLAWLPLAWVKQHLACYAQWLVCGFTINCPESADTVATDLRDIGPTYHVATPRSLESLLEHVTLRMEDAPPVKRRLYLHFLGVAARIHERELAGEPVSVTDRLQYALGGLLIYAPLKDALGVTRIRVLHVAGEAIGSEVFAFYRSLGVNLKPVYGGTECAGVVCVPRDGPIVAHSVGPPIDGMEVRVEREELLIRGPGLALGVADAGGWFRTGDAAEIDAAGNVRIIDRHADLLTVAGVRFSPQAIENRLRFSQYVREAIVSSDGRNSVVCVINIDYTSVRDWAERKQYAYGGYGELVALAPVAGLIGERIAEVNRALSAMPGLARAQISRFAILHKELDADDREMTRTHKLRRAFVSAKYASLFEAMHRGDTEHRVEAAVRFDDGRQDVVAATLAIHAARMFDPAGARPAPAALSAQPA